MFFPCKPPLFGALILCWIKGPWPNWGWITNPILAPILAGVEVILAMQTFISGCHYAIFAMISGLVVIYGRCDEFMKSKGEVHFLVKGYRQLQISEKILIPVTEEGFCQLQFFLFHFYKFLVDMLSLRCLIRPIGFSCLFLRYFALTRLCVA